MCPTTIEKRLRYFVYLILIAIPKLSIAQTNPPYIPKIAIHDLELNSGDNWLDIGLKKELSDNIKMIGLGEVSHGSYEPLAFKSKLVKYLILHKEIRKIFFEYPQQGAFELLRNILLDNTVKSKNRVDSIINNISLLPLVYKKVTIELFRWIKDYNLGHPKDMVQIYGIDIVEHTNYFDHIIEYYLRNINSTLTDQLIIDWKKNKSSDSTKLHDIVSFLQKNKTYFHNKPLDEKMINFEIFSVKNQIIYDSLLRLENTINERSQNSVIFRDSILALNVKHLIGTDKAIIWAHNEHIFNGEYSMGSYLEKWYKSNYYIILTDYSEYANVAVAIKTQEATGSRKFKIATIESANVSIGNILFKRYNTTNAIYFQKNLSKLKIYDRINGIDLFGKRVILGSMKKAYDAVAVFDTLSTKIPK